VKDELSSSDQDQRVEALDDIQQMLKVGFEGVALEASRKFR